MRKLAPLLLASVLLAGCGGSLAQSASEQGNPCNAHTLEPSNARYTRECEQAKHGDEVRREAGEAEQVLRKRHAEELANAAEGR